MPQQEITEFLNKNKGWYNSREIAKEINKGVNSVQKSLLKLRGTTFIKFESIPSGRDFRYSGVEKK